MKKNYLRYKHSLLLDIACEAERLGVKDEELETILASTREKLYK